MVDAGRFRSFLFSVIVVAAATSYSAHGAEPARSPVTIRSSALEVVTVASGNRRVVFRAPGRMEAPVFSPDGETLYFNRIGHMFRLRLTPNATPVFIDTGPETHCNNDHGISPDGTILAISDLTETGKSLIYLLPIGGGTPTRVDLPPPSYWHGWSPDGKTFAFCGGREGNYDIYTLPVGGGTATRLTSAPQNDNGPDYSADGRWIYFHSERTGHFQIWRMHADGSHQEQVTSDDYYNWFPHPSPDGKWIAILSSKAPPETGHPPEGEYLLRLIPAAGGQPRELARFFGGNGSLNSPCWSRDGTQLAFSSYESAP